MSIPEDGSEAGSPTSFRSLGGGRYEAIDCPTGRCPRVNVAEMPYERQVDETDDAYGQRLRRRANVAADIGNQAELLAILTAMQDDLDIPQAGLTIPCETADEWLTVAFLQGVEPDSWETAEPEPVGDWDTWFSTELYTESLRRYIGEKFRYGSMSGLADNTFVGPDGLLYNLHTAQRERNNQLRGLYIELSTHLGYAVADAGDQVPAPTRFANLETLDPPLFGMRGMLWEFESETAPSEADHGENIVLAQWDPTGRGITGPLNRQTGRPRTSVGAQPGGPRTGIKHGNARPPRARGSIPQWLKDRFARGNRNEARVRSDQGLPKNTQTVEGRDKDGNTVKTIPDSLPPGQVIEIKDVKILSNTRQIQAQASYAKANNREYVVYTGPRGSTHITQPARDTITRAGGRIVEVPYLGKGD
jgi:hypothetical protein